MTDEDPEIETSLLSGEHERDGVTINVQIYCLAEKDARWSLEVINEDGLSTVWEETFPTDQDAYRTFYSTLEAEGIETFLEKKS